MSKFKYYVAVGRFSCQMKGVTVPEHPGPVVREVLYKEGRNAMAKHRAYLKQRVGSLPTPVRSVVARRRRAMKGGEWLRKSAQILFRLDITLGTHQAHFYI